MTNHLKHQTISTSILTLTCALFTNSAIGALTYTGISLAGAEGGGSTVGLNEHQYVIPSEAYINEFVVNQRMNTIRIPFRWERLQLTPSASFNRGDPADPEHTDYWGLLKVAVDQVLAKGGKVVIGPHNYGRYDGQVIGVGNTTNADFSDLWSRLATVYKNNENVLFSLMNEPHSQNTDELIVTLNQAIAAIRATGASNTILVSGNRWSGAHSWNKSNDEWGRSNAQAMLDIVDTDNNLVFVAHQYIDGNLQPFTDWLKQYGKRGFVEEFAASNQPECLDALKDMLQHMKNNEEYIGFTYWASGKFWNNEFYLIRPQHLKPNEQTEDKGTEQLNILKPFLHTNATNSQYEVVTVSGNGDGFLTRPDNTRQWIDVACMLELADASVPITPKPWSEVGPLSSSSETLSCTEIENLFQVVCSTNECSDPKPTWTVAIVSGNGDGFLLTGDGSRQWLSSECIIEIMNAGISTTPTPWAQVDPLSDTQNHLDCAAIISAMSGDSNPPTDPPTSNWIVAKVSANPDGFLLLGDGTRQWLDESCMSLLQSSGVEITPTPWSDVGPLSDTQNQVECSDIKNTLL